MLVSFFGNVEMKSLRGMPASRTQIVMICFSRLRISATLSRSCSISASNIFGDSFSSMNSPASFLRTFCVFGSLAPFSSQRLERLLVELGDREEAARRLFRIRAGLERFLVFRAPVGLFVLLGLVRRRCSCRSRGELRIHGRGDLIGRVRVDEADDDVDQPALAGLHLLVLAQHELERHRVARQRGAHRVETFLDALGDADFAFARQQLDRAHLAHVHAHRVGGAAELGVDGGERGGGFFGGFFVGDDRFRQQQRFGLRCLLVHRECPCR